MIEFNEQTIALILAILAAVWKWWQERQVQAFFDPDDPLETPPSGTPTRSYKMSDGVRGYLLFGHTEQEQADLSRQIDDAERDGKIKYTISWGGGYYRIEYGQIIGGSR